MAKFKTEDLIAELKEDVQHILEAAEHIRTSDKNKLVYQIDKEKWSVVQILEHMNAYGRYYLPAIAKALEEDKSPRNAWFESGFWGNYFTKTMKPSNVRVIKNKMKAMKAYCFPNSLNVEQVTNEFIQQQQILLGLLDRAKDKNLNAKRIPITVTSLIKLKLGDVFRFLVAHEQRHMIQARNTLKAVGVTTDRFPVILTTSESSTAKKAYGAAI
ncbi:DinB family protein [Flavisolibacter tropicus]|uniref:DinB family protein n=1 Tax=Flavisolibacter tropicus TaxID=1492898 RepID=UPI00082E1B90|nr:DinB family protein [Flavisolibacter tropicus]